MSKGDRPPSSSPGPAAPLWMEPVSSSCTQQLLVLIIVSLYSKLVLHRNYSTYRVEGILGEKELRIAKGAALLFVLYLRGFPRN